ncbi:MAG: zinc-binding dehydrogenase [Gammaproteobacteria bacterium]|nr:zinc-binding dehydrogenase [Gammaproteobacteria bacterium]MBT4494199.1 zinc-binding dehydrogenase [Gammaproteobacteria bacterium]MBT7370788.1 zinc-binding dehydrogenase [Gammaproteobacteria bacterium]
MKAAVFHGPRDVRFEDIAKPDLEDGDILLRVKACGICGSDLHTYRHGMFLQLGNPIESGRILGHEFSGEVAEISGDVQGIKVGDRVVTIGMGGNAEYIRIPKEMTAMLLPFDESISFIEAATTEPLATSLHGANLGDAKDGETHVIIGAGIIGLGILQCIKARSSAKVTVVDLSDKRLTKATELGADVVINAGRTNLVEELLGTVEVSEENILNEVPGTVDTIYDCAGMGKNFKGPSVLQQAIQIVRENGKVVVVAVFEQDVSIDYNVIVRKGIQVLGSWAWTMEEFVESSQLIVSGRIDRKPLVSHTFPLEKASDAYETQLLAEEAIKVVFTP